MLEAILVIFLLAVLVTLAVIGVTVGLCARSLERRSRLHPSIKTAAPLAWGWSPTSSARLHRRLQGAVAPIVVTPPRRRGGRAETGTRGAVDLATALADQAAAVDRDVIDASRQPTPVRRSRFRELRSEVRQIEALAARLQQHQQKTSAHPAPRQQVLADVETRLDLLTAAHDELTAIERASTASDPDEVLRRITPRPQAMPVGNGLPAPGTRARRPATTRTTLPR